MFNPFIFIPPIIALMSSRPRGTTPDLSEEERAEIERINGMGFFSAMKYLEKIGSIKKKEDGSNKEDRTPEG